MELVYMMVKQKLSKALEQAVLQAQKQGLIAFTSLPEITVEHPQNKEHGDYATNLPLKLARAAGAAPQVIANRIIELMPSLPAVAQMVVAAPGFFNFTFMPNLLAR